jgi:hypothetical protein
MEKNALDWIAGILVVIGAINWGLVGVNSLNGVDYSWDIVAMLTGSISYLSAAIYILIALSGLWLLVKMFK